VPVYQGEPSEVRSLQAKCGCKAHCTITLYIEMTSHSLVRLIQCGTKNGTATARLRICRVYFSTQTECDLMYYDVM
jgi:hypothetical protein